MGINELYRLTNLILTVLVCGYALWRGGRSERCFAAIFAIGSVASAIAIHLSSARWKGFEPGLLAVDLAVLACLIGLLKQTDRFWPLWVTALHIDTVGVHLARSLKPAAVSHAYMFGAQLAMYPMLAMLAWGTIAHHRRQRKPPASTT